MTFWSSYNCADSTQNFWRRYISVITFKLIQLPHLVHSIETSFRCSSLPLSGIDLAGVQSYMRTEAVPLPSPSKECIHDKLRFGVVGTCGSKTVRKCCRHSEMHLVNKRADIHASFRFFCFLGNEDLRLLSKNPVQSLSIQIRPALFPHGSGSRCGYKRHGVCLLCRLLPDGRSIQKHHLP